MMKGSVVISKLRRLGEMSEVVVDGVTWTKLPDNEFKVSPLGTKGDYDTGCLWVDAEELPDRFPSEETFEFEG